MSLLSRISSARSLVSFMETIISLPNRPELRCAPHANLRAGAEMVATHDRALRPTAALPPR